MSIQPPTRVAVPPEPSGAEEVVELAEEANAAPSPSLTMPAILIIAAVLGCSLYANMSTLVVDRTKFRFFPPFISGVNRNDNNHLAAEYNSIAGALVAGRGFADPFREQTGPTAWMPPVLPVVIAGLRWIAGNDMEAVTAMFVLLQDLSLIGTGLLLIALTRRTTGQVWLTTFLYIGVLCFYFRLCFQFTHDCWIVLAALDVLIWGLVWLRPFEGSKRRAAVWGIVGGMCALVSPIVGLCWAVAALGCGLPKGRRSRFAIAVLLSMLTITPWIIRNWLLFERLIPVKSNLAYELYQAQIVQPGGVLQGNIFGSHPYATDGEERWQYRKDGEMKFLDKKWNLFVKAVQENPGDFAERVANRFFAATLEYSPFNLSEKTRGERGGLFSYEAWVYRTSQLVYPLPFLALVVLLVSAAWQPLSSAQWIVIGIYVSYLLPYILVSFYERYKFPIVVAEVALLVWGVHFAYRCIFGAREARVV